MEFLGLEQKLIKDGRELRLIKLQVLFV